MITEGKLEQFCLECLHLRVFIDEVLHSDAKDGEAVGSRFQLPSLTVDEVKALLKEMKNDGAIHVVGRTRGARWFPGAD